MQIKTFIEAEKYLNQFIPTGSHYKFPGELGLMRTKKLLEVLGNPQNTIKTIHIAGTSGKGSTAYLCSILLKSQGFNVGLFLSPHLTNIRERIQINNNLITEKEFTDGLNALSPSIEKMRETIYGAPTYFEVITALGFYFFHKKGVDYSVIETGLGGLYDATNTIDSKNKLVILTKIGLDHTQILGNTIAKIAYQKSEIIKEHNTILSAWQTTSGRNVIEKTALRENADIYYVRKNNNYKNINIEIKRTKFNFKFKELEMKNTELGLIGHYQAENCSLALAALYILSQRDKFTLDTAKIKSTLKHAVFEGRLSIKKIKGKTLILDGAHNPQKMGMFISTLKSLYPHKKLNFLISFKKGKDYRQMLKRIIPIANSITLTTFVSSQGIATPSADLNELENILKSLKYRNYLIVKDIKKAATEILKSEDPIIATGSLYFMNNLYLIFEKEYIKSG